VVLCNSINISYLLLMKTNIWIMYSIIFFARNNCLLYLIFYLNTSLIFKLLLFLLKIFFYIISLTKTLFTILRLLLLLLLLLLLFIYFYFYFYFLLLLFLFHHLSIGLITNYFLWIFWILFYKRRITIWICLNLLYMYSIRISWMILIRNGSFIWFLLHYIGLRFQLIFLLIILFFFLNGKLLRLFTTIVRYITFSFI